MRWDDMSKNEMQRPDEHEFMTDRRHVYGLVRHLLETRDGHAPISEQSPI